VLIGAPLLILGVTAIQARAPTIRVSTSSTPLIPCVSVCPWIMPRSPIAYEYDYASSYERHHSMDDDACVALAAMYQCGVRADTLDNNDNKSWCYYHMAAACGNAQAQLFIASLREPSTGMYAFTSFTFFGVVSSFVTSLNTWHRIASRLCRCVGV
jgi:hypothetical protein